MQSAKNPYFLSEMFVTFCNEHLFPLSRLGSLYLDMYLQKKVIFLPVV